MERRSYPADPPGRAVPALRSLVLALKFFGVVIVGNIVALLLLLIPGVNIGAFFLVNGYLLGREFFEFAAMRFRPEAEAKALRRQTCRHGVPGRAGDRGLPRRAAAQPFDAAVCGGDDGASPQDGFGDPTGTPGGAAGTLTRASDQQRARRSNYLSRKPLPSSSSSSTMNSALPE